MDLEQPARPQNTATSNPAVSSSSVRLDFIKLIPPAISSWFHPNTTMLANSINDAIAHDITKSPSDVSLADSTNSVTAENNEVDSSVLITAAASPQPNILQEERERDPSVSPATGGSKIAARLEMLRRKTSDTNSGEK